MFIHPLLSVNLYISCKTKPCHFNWSVCLLKTKVVQGASNLTVYKDDIMKLYNGIKLRMNGADLPVFTPLKTVKNPGTLYMVLQEISRYSSTICGQTDFLTTKYMILMTE